MKQIEKLNNILRHFEDLEKGLQVRQIYERNKYCERTIRNEMNNLVSLGCLRLEEFDRQKCARPIKNWSFRHYYLTEKGMELKNKLYDLIYIMEYICSELYTETPKSLNSSNGINKNEVKNGNKIN